MALGPWPYLGFALLRRPQEKPYQSKSCKAKRSKGNAKPRPNSEYTRCNLPPSKAKYRHQHRHKDKEKQKQKQKQAQGQGQGEGPPHKQTNTCKNKHKHTKPITDTRVATGASTIGPRLRLCFASATLRVAKLSQAVQNQTEQNQPKPEQAKRSKAKGQAKQSTVTQCKREAKVHLWIHALQSIGAVLCCAALCCSFLRCAVPCRAVLC